MTVPVELTPEEHGAVVDSCRPEVPIRAGRRDWAALPDGHHLWNGLVHHLHGAGLLDELDAVLVDPGWLVGTLRHAGPVGLELSHAGGCARCMTSTWAGL